MSNCQQVTFVVAFVASLTGCADNLAPHTAPETPTIGSDRATVTGHVVDTSGAPVAGAAVALRGSGEHAMADSTGAFTLDVPANTTLTLSASAPTMAPTLLQQFLVSAGTTAQVEVPLITTDHFQALVKMGMNPAGGVVAVAVKSLSGAAAPAPTVQLTPSRDRRMPAPAGPGLPDPAPAMAAVVPAVEQGES